MEIVIRDRLLEMLKTATVTDVEDNHPVSFLKYLPALDSISDYPTIVVIYPSIDPEAEQIQGVTLNYTLHIYILNVGATFAETEEQRNIIKNRCVAYLRNNHNLGKLADNNSSEKVFDSRLGKIDFDIDGYEGNFTGVARIIINVYTDKIKPY